MYFAVVISLIYHTKVIQPQDGEQITCPNCGKSNDYSSLRQLAIQEGHEKVKGYAINEIRKIFKKFK